MTDYGLVLDEVGKLPGDLQGVGWKPTNSAHRNSTTALPFWPAADDGINLGRTE